MRLVKDRVVEHPHRYKLTKVAGTDDVYDLEQVPGTVTDAGTAVNRQLFNSIDSALLCTHSKTGTVHTFTLNSNVAAFVPGQTIYTVKAALTASIEYGDTFTLTDGTTSYTGIVPKTSEGGNYRVTLYQELSPVVIFEVNLGGSAKHAFFRGGGQKRLFREVFIVSGSWTCPDFVDEVYVMAFGGGGGGGSGLYNAPGGGGSGGNMVESLLSVTPGAKYTVTIGAGGAGGTISGSTFSAGGNGGATTFGNQMTATGGAGGPAKSNTGGGSQFAAASGSTGADGYGLSAHGGRSGNVQINASVTPVVSVGGGGGGASYGKGGEGGTLLPTGTARPRHSPGACSTRISHHLWLANMVVAAAAALAIMPKAKAERAGMESYLSLITPTRLCSPIVRLKSLIYSPMLLRQPLPKQVKQKLQLKKPQMKPQMKPHLPRMKRQKRRRIHDLSWQISRDVAL